MTKKFLDDNLDPIFGFTKLIRFAWSTASNKLAKSCVTVEWSDKVDEGDDDCVVEENENEEDAEEKKPVKKEAKKPAAKNQKSKLDMAVASERNNSSLLNFFQKSAQQKRTVNSANGCVDVTSHFLLNRKLKVCQAF